MATKLHLVLADIHFPVHCRKSIRAVLQFIERHRANIESCVLLGDFPDSENVSPHTRNRPRLRKRGGYKYDIDGFKLEILDQLDRLLKPTCRKTSRNRMTDPRADLEHLPDLNVFDIARNKSAVHVKWPFVFLLNAEVSVWLVRRSQGRRGS
jgi:hypothetical protein